MKTKSLSGLNRKPVRLALSAVGCGLIAFIAGCRNQPSAEMSSNVPTAPARSTTASLPPIDPALNARPLPAPSPKVQKTHQKLHLTKNHDRFYFRDDSGRDYLVGRDDRGDLYPAYYDSDLDQTVPLYYDGGRDRYYRLIRDEDRHYYRNYVDDPDDQYYRDDSRFGDDYVGRYADDLPLEYDDSGYLLNALPSVSSGHGSSNRDAWLLAIPVIVAAYFLLQPRHHNPAPQTVYLEPSYGRPAYFRAAPAYPQYLVTQGPRPFRHTQFHLANYPSRPAHLSRTAWPVVAHPTFRRTNPVVAAPRRTPRYPVAHVATRPLAVPARPLPRAPVRSAVVPRKPLSAYRNHNRVATHPAGAPVRPNVLHNAHAVKPGIGHAGNWNATHNRPAIHAAPRVNNHAPRPMTKGHFSKPPTPVYKGWAKRNDAITHPRMPTPHAAAVGHGREMHAPPAMVGHGREMHAPPAMVGHVNNGHGVRQRDFHNNKVDRPHGGPGHQPNARPVSRPPHYMPGHQPAVMPISRPPHNMPGHQSAGGPVSRPPHNMAGHQTPVRPVSRPQAARAVQSPHPQPNQNNGRGAHQGHPEGPKAQPGHDHKQDHKQGHGKDKDH